MKDQLITYIKSGFPLIAINTREVSRAIGDINKIMDMWNKSKEGLRNTTAPEYLKERGFSIHVWDRLKGWGDANSKNMSDPGDPVMAFNFPMGESPCGLYVLSNFHLQWSDQLSIYPELVEHITSISTKKIPFKHLLFVGLMSSIPQEISHLFAWIDYELPTREITYSIMDKFEKQLRKPLKRIEKVQVADAVAGMTYYEAEQAIKASMVKTKGKGINVKDLFAEKAKTVRKSGLLDYMEVEDTIKSVGGLENLKAEVAKMAKVFKNREASEKYGLPVPRGILLCGLSGCGKSLVAKVVANEFGVALYNWDLGKLFGGIVGDTERNTREAFKLIKSVSPAVFFLDEIEKSIGGAASSSYVDAGITEKVVGAFLTFMQEKTCPAFFVATANSVDRLAPEVLRRFNSIWFVDLPDKIERKEIFNIHLTKTGRKPSKFDVSALVRKTDKRTGAEIQSIIEDAMYQAFYQNREYTTRDIADAIVRSPLMIDTKEKDIDALRAWSKGRARIANVKPGKTPYWQTANDKSADVILDSEKITEKDKGG